MTVQNFIKVVWTVSEKIEFFMKRSGEKKRHDCRSSRKFFPTPTNEVCLKRRHKIQNCPFHTSFLILSVFKSPVETREQQKAS